METVKTYKRPTKAVSGLSTGLQAVLFHGECERLISVMPDDYASLILSSPPYCMGKAYEDTSDIADFKKSHEILLPELIRVLKPGGSLCWQVGFHVQETSGVITPLDFLVYNELLKYPQLKLRNRIVWTFGHGQHCKVRFSGRYETVLWFTKGDEYTFDLDSVRIPQKYPGKLASHGAKKGKPSGNPLGKNPGDVWEIPNVKANHVEKTDHPCQFPVGLAHRLVRALSKKDDVVFDPFAGVSSTGVAALLAGRKFIGAEIIDDYVAAGMRRLRDTVNGEIGYRPAEKEIHVPKATDKVAICPPGFGPVAANEAIPVRTVQQS